MPRCESASHGLRVALAAAAPLLAPHAFAQTTVAAVQLDKVEISGHYDNSVGSSEAASQGVFGQQLIEARPLLRKLTGDPASEFRPAVVFCDIGMPKVNGYDATRRIRAEESPRGSHVPIIAMTACAMSGDRERCLAAGLDHYLTKPLHIEALDEALAQYGSGSAVARPSGSPA